MTDFAAEREEYLRANVIAEINRRDDQIERLRKELARLNRSNKSRKRMIEILQGQLSKYESQGC